MYFIERPVASYNYAHWVTRTICFDSIVYRKSKGCTLPSTFLTKKKDRNALTERLFTYDRDIMCLPKSFGGNGGLTKIPRKQCVREFLAVNSLIGKIRLTSAMSEKDIMNEIRSVFEDPMDRDKLFRFKILQPSGGASKSLSVPVRSASFKWTASSVAGKNARVPVYILAQDKLKVNHTSVYTKQKYVCDVYKCSCENPWMTRTVTL